MLKYLALLRGINVGGNSKVEMSRLKKVFEDLGFRNVSTYINSGNVLFESDQKDPEKLDSEIEKALLDHFGFPIRVVIRTAENIQKLAKEIPVGWTNDTDQKTDVLFLWEEFCNKSSLDLITINPDVDNLKYIDGAVIWNVKRANYPKSGMNKFIGTKVYKNMTARNVNTVRKLAGLI